MNRLSVLFGEKNSKEREGKGVPRSTKGLFTGYDDDQFINENVNSDDDDDDDNGDGDNNLY